MRELSAPSLISRPTKTRPHKCWWTEETLQGPHLIDHKNTTFHLTGWRLLHPTEKPGDLHVPTECHILMLNTIVLQLSDIIADISMPLRRAHFKIPLTNVQFVADNAAHALASTATVKLTFNDVEEDVVNRNGRTPKREESSSSRSICSKEFATCLKTCGWGKQ